MIAAAWASGAAGSVDLEKTLAHYEAAVKLLEAEPDSAEKGLSYSGLAHGLLRVLDLEGALRQGTQALAMGERLNDLNQVGQACIELAPVLACRGELAQAQEYADRCWEAALQGREPWLKARAGLWPVWVWPWRNDRAWLEKWVGRCLDYGQRSGVGNNDRPLYELSALFSTLSGRPHEAADALRHAEEAVSRRPYLYPYVYFGGAARAVLGDWEQASHLVATALEVAESGHDRLWSVEGCIYYGGFLLASGDTVRADEVLSRGHALAHEKGSIVQELNLLPLLCELHARTGDLEQAEQDLKRAQEILARLQEWRGLAAGVYLAEGILATARDNWPEAEKAFGEALETERTHGFLYHEARVMVAWGEMHLLILSSNQ